MSTTISGFLGADPELKFTNNGVAVAKLRVGVTKRVKQADGSFADGETTWIDVSAWRQLAENCTESLVKGSKVLITGELKQRSFERKDGSTGTVIELEASDVGPSLTMQTAKVAKASRADQQSEGMRILMEASTDVWASEKPQAEAAPF